MQCVTVYTMQQHCTTSFYMALMSHEISTPFFLVRLKITLFYPISIKFQANIWAASAEMSVQKSVLYFCEVLNKSWSVCRGGGECAWLSDGRTLVGLQLMVTGIFYIFFSEFLKKFSCFFLFCFFRAVPWFHK